MENVTYQAYLENPEIRHQLEQEARRARAEAVDSFIIAPLKRAVKQLFRRAEPKAVRPMHAAA